MFETVCKIIDGKIFLLTYLLAYYKQLVAGPETTRLIDEFECSTGLYQLEKDVQGHHDSTEASEVKFFNDVLQLKKTFKEFGSPFLDNSFDLISFGTMWLQKKKKNAQDDVNV